MLITAAAVWWLAGLYLYLSPKLPEAEALTDIKLQTPLRIVSSDGQLIGQFGEQKRIPARYEDLPQSFVDALLAAEDDGFFEHSGIDFLGLARAVSELLATGSKQSGGSTITMPKVLVLGVRKQRGNRAIDARFRQFVRRAAAARDRSTPRNAVRRARPLLAPAPAHAGQLRCGQRAHLGRRGKPAR